MNNNARYQYYKNLHPEWSEEQIWLAVSCDEQAKITVKNGGDDININSPEIIDHIIRAAQRWLEENLPYIFEKVKQFFANALRSLANWARRGWEYLLEIISNPTFY